MMELRLDESERPGWVGPYRLAEPMGRGGMGVVWRAWDERLKRPVAVKHIRTDAQFTELRQRLWREAQAAARLNHSAIVHVYDLVESPDGDWIVMELVEGETLRKRIQEKGCLPFEEVIRLGLDISEGLAEAHSHGILHRDLKASNVMVTPAGRAKILDFGLAKQLPQVDGQDQEASISATGLVVGTSYAMSPEQVLGRSLDARSDLFSLGSLLYEMLVGEPPFRAATLAASQASVLSIQPPPLVEVRPRVPQALANLVGRLLEKDPRFRPQSADEVSRTLAGGLSGISATDEDSQPSTVAELALAPRSIQPPISMEPGAEGGLVERSMALSPQQRYQSAEEMPTDLLACMASVTDATLDIRVPTLVTELATRKKGPPLLHNLPLPPLGDLLKGRDEDLQVLESTLDEANNLLYGLGGIGKTRLAVEHAWRHGRKYRAVLFVSADSPEALNSGLASLARADLLDLPERDDPAEREVMAAVLRWLRDNSGWLLILDNVDTREALLAVARLLPALAGGKILITSRRRDWPPTVHRQSLSILPLSAATEFLLKRTIKDRRQQPEDVPQALRLAELLGGLPLALEQAAAYIAHTQISISDYLQTWENECDSALSWYDEAVMQYPMSLAVTWQRTFRHLKPTSKVLLQLMSFLAPDPVPIEILEKGMGIVQETTELLYSERGEYHRPIRDDIAELATVSLISRQGSNVSMHCIVQEVVRQRVPEAERKSWIERILTLLEQSAPFHEDDQSTWPIWETLRPHMVELIDHVHQHQVPDSATLSNLLVRFGTFLYTKSLYSKTESLFRKALAIDEHLFGASHYEVAHKLEGLGWLLKNIGQLEEAESILRRSLTIFEATFGHQHPVITKPLNALALLLIDTGRWTEAEQLLRRALEIDQKERGTEHPTVGRDLNNLAVLFRSSGKLAEAEILLRQALKTAQLTFGMRHPKTARTLKNLAGILKDLDLRSEAEPLAVQALEIFEQVLGPHHTLTQSARHDLEAFKQNGEASDEIETQQIPEA